MRFSGPSGSGVPWIRRKGLLTAAIYRMKREPSPLAGHLAERRTSPGRPKVVTFT